MPSTETDQSGRTDAQSRSPTAESAEADADADAADAPASTVEQAAAQETPAATRTVAGDRARAKDESGTAQAQPATTQRARPAAEPTAQQTAQQAAQQAAQQTAESRAAAAPAVDLYDAPEELVVVIDLPGYAPDAIELSGADQTLHVTAERSLDETPADTRPVRQERAAVVDRIIELPAAVDLDDASATCTRGVCRVTLPKAEHARRTQIPVE